MGFHGRELVESGALGQLQRKPRRVGTSYMALPQGSLHAHRATQGQGSLPCIICSQQFQNQAVSKFLLLFGKNVA